MAHASCPKELLTVINGLAVDSDFLLEVEAVCRRGPASLDVVAALARQIAALTGGLADGVL